MFDKNLYPKWFLKQITDEQFSDLEEFKKELENL